MVTTNKKTTSTDWLSWLRFGIVVIGLLVSGVYAFDDLREGININTSRLDSHDKWIEQHSKDYRNMLVDMKDITILQTEIKKDTEYIQQTLKEIKEELKSKD